MQTSNRLSTRPIKQCAFFLSFLAVGALQAHILEVKGLAVDPGLRRGDPVGDLSALGAGRHLTYINTLALKIKLPAKQRLSCYNPLPINK
jgi:hypothetical protein